MIRPPDTWRFPLTAGVLAVSLLLPGMSCRRAEPPGAGARIIRHISIYQGSGEYCAWPDIARTRDGDLIVVFCRSEEHLGPDGQILLARSTDNGLSWQNPQVIFNTSIDDRESGLTTLADGRIVGHFWATFHTPEFYAGLQPGSYEAPVLRRWIRHVTTHSYQAARDTQGAWCALTTDGGRSWSKPSRGEDAVHGGIQLRDGSLLVASYREEGDGIGVYVSESPLGAWSRRAVVRAPHPGSISFGEPHVLLLPSGRIIMMIRGTARPYDDQDPRCVLWETFSDDNGRTWVEPFSTPIWGFPPHLMLLNDGRILCSYGYRRPPYGQRACISDDGITWKLEDEVVLRNEAPGPDLGYPASIEVENGIVLTVYYQPDVPPGTVQRMSPPDPQRVKPGIMGTVWNVPKRRS
jgi:sialidase-1